MTLEALASGAAISPQSCSWEGAEGAGAWAAQQGRSEVAGPCADCHGGEQRSALRLGVWAM